MRIGAAVQMPEDERGNKELGRGPALAHLAQLALVLALGVLVMSRPWPDTGQWRAACGGFGVIYALQALALTTFLSNAPSALCSIVLNMSNACLQASTPTMACCLQVLLSHFAEMSGAWRGQQATILSGVTLESLALSECYVPCRHQS